MPVIVSTRVGNKEQSERSGTGMRTDHGTDVGDQGDLYAVSLLQ